MSLIGIYQKLDFGSRVESSNLSIEPSLIGSIIGFKLCFFGLDVATSGRFSCFMTLRSIWKADSAQWLSATPH